MARIATVTDRMSAKEVTAIVEKSMGADFYAVAHKGSRRICKASKTAVTMAIEIMGEGKTWREAVAATRAKLEEKAKAAQSGFTRSIIGDVVGGSSYFGKCFDCGSQFMSTADIVYLQGYIFYCEACAKKKGAR